MAVEERRGDGGKGNGGGKGCGAGGVAGGESRGVERETFKSVIFDGLKVLGLAVALIILGAGVEVFL